MIAGETPSSCAACCGESHLSLVVFIGDMLAVSATLEQGPAHPLPDAHDPGPVQVKRASAVPGCVSHVPRPGGLSSWRGEASAYQINLRTSVLPARSCKMSRAALTLAETRM